MAKAASLPKTSITPPSLYPFEFFDLLGLDTYTPDEMASSNRCVYGRNFRLYVPDNASRRTALSKRRGHTFYSVPIGETVDVSNTSTTGASNSSVGLVSWVAGKYTAGASGNLTRVDLNIKNISSGTGPLIVMIYADNSGKPGTLLATSSIPSASITSSYQYLTARFIEAPSIASSSVYWVVCSIQSNGSNNYYWSNNTTTTTALTSADGGNTWNSTSYQMNFKTYISTAGPVLGHHRYYSSGASPVTLMAHNTNLYTINDSTGATTSIKSGLNASATWYDFSTVNNKTYFVNGQDSPMVYNGAAVTSVGGSPPVADNVEIHVNCLFLLQPKTNYLVFSNPGDYENFGATSFIYIPSPNTSDPVIKIVSVAGVLYCFTRNTKYLLFGTGLLSFVLKESPSSKGAVAPNAITKDEEATYFVSNDFHVYQFNGSVDTKLSSERVAAYLRNMANTSSVIIYVDDKKLYISYIPTGQSTNRHRLVYDLVFNEWLSDEEVYTGIGESWNSQSDSNQICLASSRVGALYYGDQGYNDLGKPIKFDWWSKYMSFGAPAAKHRVKRYYTFLQSQSSNHSINCQVDVDEANSPTSNIVSLAGGGSLWGVGVWGTFLWGATNFIRTRINVPGANYKHQFRFVEAGVDTQDNIIGFTTYIQPKKPV
jgi:hypothetical protein